MTIKLVATDMDGTFLTDEKTFNKPRFQRVYDYMLQNDIQFVSASGNQYDQLRNFFKDFPETLFVAENGALVGSHSEVFRSDIFSNDLKMRVIDILNSLEDIQVIMCGQKSAYILKSSTPEFIKTSTFYFPTIQLVDDFKNVDDGVLKFSCNCPDEETEFYMQKLADLIGPKVSISTSGHGDIDVVRADVNKAYGLEYLANKLNIKSEEMCAFGDGGNDLEMLRYVGHSVAMENGSPIVLEIAKYQTINNNQQGVIVHLEEIFDI